MSIEFEHFMGTNTIPQGAAFHPDNQKYVFAAGATVVIADLLDPHNQQFLRFHSDTVNAIAVSACGRFIASGQIGEQSDVIVYDYSNQTLLYRFEEHDHGIQCLAFSEDSKLLASIGMDNQLILWDLSNGCIVTTSSKLPPQTSCLSFLGFVKDIKRRDTNHYQICTAGAVGILLWDLDPYTGTYVLEMQICN
jgi:cilia- and flagella-associated protein 52